MSLAYNNYLDEHISNVNRAFEWIRTYLPEVVEWLKNDMGDNDIWSITKNHDDSKYSMEEYDAYDAYFYGKDKTSKVKEDFNRAWLHHIHNNPHHWQYYCLINDEAEEGMVVLDMPIRYIVEMICDWWAFSWKSGNLREIFKWYLVHKDYMKLSDNTRMSVEDILARIKDKLDEMEGVDD